MFTSYVTLQSNVLAGYVTLQGSGQPCHSKQCRYLQKMKVWLELQLTPPGLNTFLQESTKFFLAVEL